MRFKLLFVLLALAIKSFAANPYIPFSVDFEKSGDDRQFDIQSRVLSTPTLRFYTLQGANVFDPSAYVSTFSFAEDWNATNMVKITGTNYSSYVEFAVTSNTFAYPIDKWYASVLLTKPADGGVFAGRTATFPLNHPRRPMLMRRSSIPVPSMVRNILHLRVRFPTGRLR